MSDCDCETHGPKFTYEERRTSRKERQCGECKAVISVGTRYLRLIGKDSDREFWSFVMCLDCNDLWDELYEVYAENGEKFCECLGKLQELCHEALDFDTQCYHFVQRLVEKGFLNEGDVCPGSTLTRVFHADPDQLELALA